MIKACRQRRAFILQRIVKMIIFNIDIASLIFIGIAGIVLLIYGIKTLIEDILYNRRYKKEHDKHKNNTGND